MPTRRQQRLNGLLYEELSLLIPGRLDDPRLDGALITKVEVTQDLSTAKVYATSRSMEPEEADEVVRALEHAHARIRDELGGLGLRRLPRLVFARDRDFESGERVLALLDQLHDEAGAAPEGEAEGGASAATSTPR